MIVTIETKDAKIKYQAEVLKVKAELIEKGFDKFPKEELLKECPFKSNSKVNEWITSAQNVWNKGTHNPTVLEALNKINDTFRS